MSLEHEEAPAVAVEPAIEVVQATVVQDQLIENDELVEDVSIDGMCGVY